MANTGDPFIDTVFNACVVALVWLADQLGVTYEAVNVWLFCVIWPALTVGLATAVVVLWRKSRECDRPCYKTGQFAAGCRCDGTPPVKFGGYP